MRQTEENVGCARPTSEVPSASPGGAPVPTTPSEEKPMSQVRIGAKAPDFKAPAYQHGAFGQVALSDYAGKWLLLCFYPGDFTFV